MNKLENKKSIEEIEKDMEEESAEISKNTLQALEVFFENINKNEILKENSKLNDLYNNYQSLKKEQEDSSGFEK